MGVYLQTSTLILVVLKSSPQISEWDVATGKGLFLLSSNYAPTHVFIPSWEGYQLQLSAEF